MAMTLKFYLKRPNSKKETSIYFLLNYGAYVITTDRRRKYLPFKYYTTESILPQKWDFSKGEPLAPTAKNKRVNAIEYKELKAKLEHIEAVAKDICRRLENDGHTLSKELLLSEFDKAFKGEKEIETKRTTDLLSFIDDYIERSEKRTATKKQYMIVRNNIAEYAEIQRKRPTFNDVTLDYYLDFVEFLNQKGYSPNTIGARIKGLKLFMNEAYERGLHTNLDFRKKRFSKPHEETNAIYLTENELKKMYEFDFSNNRKLDRVRDLFLIGCCTGLRFSDWPSLHLENIDKGKGLISIRTQKTGTWVTIPIHPYVTQILKKYQNELPKIPSNQKFNEYIKEVAKEVGIDENISIQKRKGNFNYDKAIPKYELISSHTARRSFATNAYLSGIKPISIMMITGHKTETAFMKYIKISSEENAIQLQKSKFFSPLVIAK